MRTSQSHARHPTPILRLTSSHLPQACQSHVCQPLFKIVVMATLPRQNVQMCVHVRFTVVFRQDVTWSCHFTSAPEPSNFRHLRQLCHEGARSGIQQLPPRTSKPDASHRGKPSSAPVFRRVQSTPPNHFFLSFLGGEYPT